MSNTETTYSYTVITLERLNSEYEKGNNLKKGYTDWYPEGSWSYKTIRSAKSAVTRQFNNCPSTNHVDCIITTCDDGTAYASIKTQ